MEYKFKTGDVVKHKVSGQLMVILRKAHRLKPKYPKYIVRWYSPKEDGDDCHSGTAWEAELESNPCL